MSKFYEDPINPINHYAVQKSKKIAKDYGLYFSGIGGGVKEGKKVLVDVNFDHKGKPINIEEGRRLIIKITEELLMSINNNEQIRDLMYIYPFTTKNVNVAIFFLDSENNLINHPNLRAISVFNEKLRAYTRLKEKPNSYELEIKENYHEALKIANYED